MERFRIKQMQSLLEEAGKSKNNAEKFKTPKAGKINVDLFEEVLNELIEAEEFIYSSRPSQKLDENDAKLFCNRIITARRKLDNMLADFGVLERESGKNEIKKLSENFLILTTKSSFKKALQKLGVEPQRIIVAGVPLELEDMKLINPKIPEKALIPIKKKIEHVKNDIERKRDQFNPSEILVVVEDDKTGEVLGSRAQELYSAQVIVAENLKEINADEFKGILS